jgi:flagellar M-ring protein FliF
MNQSLANFAKQLRGIWGQLGLNQRVSVVVATAVVLGGLGAVTVWSSRTSYALLYGKLSDGEAGKVVQALDDAKVPYKTGAGGSSIYVPSDKVHQVRMQLASKGMPRGEGVGFEIFDKPNFGISDFVQRANYVRAVQGELARTISELDDIEQARVMIVLPENRLLLDRNRKPTASVYVRVRGNSPLPGQAVNSIRFLVANAVEGLSPNFVTVVDNQGNTLSENVEDDSITGLTGTQLTARRNLEQYLGKKVEGMLEKVLGPGQAIVRVAADLNYDTVTAVEEKFDPEGQVIRSETKNDENVDTSQAASTEAVGVSANTGTNVPSAAPVSSSRNQKITARVEYEISKTTSNIFMAGGGLRRLSAAVTVATKVSGTGVERKLAPRTPKELDDLRQMVVSALGADTNRTDHVTLVELPFNDEYATEVTRQLQREDQFHFWLGLARSIGYPLFTVAIVLLLVRLLKKTPVDELPIGVPVSQLAKNLNGNGNGNGTEWKRHAGQEVVTVEVLNQIVKENPGNMSHAIRNWMAREGNHPES